MKKIGTKLSASDLFELTVGQQEEVGVYVAELFGINYCDKTKKQYPTTWGTKTALGLGACVERIINKAKTPKETA